MFPTNDHSTLRKTRSRRRRSKLKQQHPIPPVKSDHRLTNTNSTLVHRFREIINDLRRSWTRFLSYSIPELEPICHQLAIQQMSSTTPVTEYCSLVCVFCQSLIYEPITLYCGHTYCDQCIKDAQISTNMDCPRCPQDIQGQIQSSITHAHENSYEKNRFIKQLLEHSEKLKRPCQIISLVRKGQAEYAQGNYQKAIDIYSRIIDQCMRIIFCFLFFFIILLNFFKDDKDDHLALNNRAKAYSAIQNYDQALIDATHVISVKPKWIKVRFRFRVFIIPKPKRNFIFYFILSGLFMSK